MHHTLALVPRSTDEQFSQKDLSVSKRCEMQLTPVSPPIIVGPGRILHHTYKFMGHYVESGTNRVAHKLGRGPLAVIQNITDALGDGSVRESRLKFLQRASNGKRSGSDLDVSCLEKNCRQLLKYAQPSESPSAQLEAFKGIVMLTTRYSCLRSVFARSDVLKRARDHDKDISYLWARTGDDYGMPPQKLACPSEEGLGPVEKIIIHCSEDSGLSRLTAIRCLGGILELPSFWSIDNYKPQRLVVSKLCKAVMQLAEDFDVDCIDGDIFSKRYTSDMEGIDLLSDALLSGVQDWIRLQLAADISTELWFSTFIDVVHLFRNPTTETPFPKTWSRASIDWRSFIRSHTGGVVPPSVPGIDEYEDDYISLDVNDSNIESDHPPFPDIISAGDVPAPPELELKEKDPSFQFLRPFFTGWWRREAKSASWERTSDDWVHLDDDSRDPEDGRQDSRSSQDILGGGGRFTPPIPMRTPYPFTTTPVNDFREPRLSQGSGTSDGSDESYRGFPYYTPSIGPRDSMELYRQWEDPRDVGTQSPYLQSGFISRKPIRLS